MDMWHLTIAIGHICHMFTFMVDRVMTPSDHSNDPKPNHCHFVNRFEAPTTFAVTPYLHNTPSLK